MYADAIEQALNEPEYALAELRSYSESWPISGEELSDFVAKTEEQVKAVEYWKLEE